MTPCEKCQKYDDCRTGTGGGLTWPCGAYAPTAKTPEENIEIPEVKSLRWLAMNFPFTEKPADETDRLCNAIHVYATAGADLIEKLAENLRHNTVEGIVEGIKATMGAASASGDAISREAAMRAFTGDPQPTYTLGQIVAILDALPGVTADVINPSGPVTWDGTPLGSVSSTRNCSGVCIDVGYTCPKLQPDFSCEFDRAMEEVT